MKHLGGTAKWWLLKDPGYKLYRASASADLELMREVLSEAKASSGSADPSETAPTPIANWRNENGETCVYACAEYMIENFSLHHEALRLLIAFGADVNICDERGVSPLSKACWYGHQSIAAVLLEAGADPTLVDVEGRDALYSATLKQGATLGHTACKKLVEDALARVKA